MRAYLRTAMAAGIAAPGMAVSPGPASAEEQLALVERATTDTVTDLGAKGDSVGDILTFANEVYDQEDKKLLGHDNGWCVRVVVGESWQCRWTLILDRGQITVQGPYYDKKDSVLAVTGGTGDYSSAQGQMKLRQKDQQGKEYEFIYSLIE